MIAVNLPYFTHYAVRPESVRGVSERLLCKFAVWLQVADSVEKLDSRFSESEIWGSQTIA